jgi:hypothetical protein
MSCFTDPSLVHWMYRRDNGAIAPFCFSEYAWYTPNKIIKAPGARVTCLACMFEYDDYTRRDEKNPMPGRFKDEK